MYIDKHIPNQQEGEELVLFLRRHIITLIGYCLFYALLLIMPFVFYAIFFYFSLIDIEYITNNAFFYPIVILLASAYFLYIWLMVFNSFINYYLDVWIVTNKRIINIEQKNLFNREIAEHTLDRIQDVSGVQKGFWQTFFSYGDVHVQTAGEIQRFIFQKVNDPFEIVRLINSLIQKKEEKLEGAILDKLSKEME